MNFDSHLKKIIQEAEQKTPETETKVSVISLAKEDFVSEDEAQYMHMYTQLPLGKRQSLLYDFNTYNSLAEIAAEFQNTARSCLANPDDVEKGPLLLRITRPLMRSPKHWRVCSTCGGSGESAEISKCNACGGHGYHV